MTRRSLDPRICPIAIDANALNRDGSAHDALVDRLLRLSSERKINLILPKRVRKEITDIRTPSHIREAVLSKIFTIQVGLSSDEQRRLRLIEQELQGNAKPGKHAADADHLFESAKYCGYFITHDQRILQKAGKITSLLAPSLTVVTLVDFLAIFDDWERRRQP
jgi:hypothetical protein